MKSKKSLAIKFTIGKKMKKNMMIVNIIWKIRYSFGILLLFIIVSSLKAQQVMWVRTFDGGSAISVCVDASNNVIVTGNVNDYDTGYLDWLTIKYNSDGDTLWTRKYHTSKDDQASDVATDIWGNVIVTGTVYDTLIGTDFCTVKYDLNGNILWVRTFTDTADTISEVAKSVATDPWGNIIVTGWGIAFSQDYVTVKYNSDGDIIWVRTYDNGWEDFGTDIAVDDSCNVIVTGFSDSNINWDWCTVKYNPQGDTLWVRRFDVGIDDWAHGVSVDKFGNVIIVGEISVESPTHRHYPAIVKYSASGNLTWDKTFTGMGGTFCDVAIDNEDNIIVANWYSRGVLWKEHDFFTAKFNLNGDTIWTAVYDEYCEESRSVAVDKSGNVIVTGWSCIDDSSCSFWRYNYLTIKYSSSTDVEGENDVHNERDCKDAYILSTFPNPFGYAGATIRYRLTMPGKVSIQVFNITGQLVKTLIDNHHSCGDYIINWDGRNQEGIHLSNGIYLLVFHTGDKLVDVKKLVLLK